MERTESAWSQTIPAAHRDGNPEAFSAQLDAVRLRSGDHVRITETGVTAFVGGNNVGKSTILREIFEHLSHPYASLSSEHHRIVEHLETTKKGSLADLFAWLRDRGYFHSHRPNTTGGFTAPRGDSVNSPGHISRSFSEITEGGHFGGLHPYIAYHSQALDRLGEIRETSRRSSAFLPPEQPMHRLEDSPSLMEEFNEICKTVFGRELTLDCLDPSIRLRVGRPNIPAPPADSISLDYRQSMASLELLSEQGDGMRSLLGLMLPIVTGSYPIIFIDEPEAFLHPPQAFQLGRILAKLSYEKRIQVILATHDRNLVAGLLNDTNIPVSIVRLDRDANRTKSFQLQSDSVGELTRDSILRYSNALEGLFHQLVVIAEGNDDCQFYQSSLEGLASMPDYDSYPPSEVLFVPSSGKQAMAKISTALRAAGVRVVATPDLDVFDDEKTIKKLITSFGGSWESFESNYKIATHAFRQNKTLATCADILGAVEGALKPHSSEPYTSERRREVQAQMRLGESPWKALKEYGMTAFKGESRKAAEQLVADLDLLGIRVVREGCLEGFAPTLGVSKGPGWLPAALEAGAHQSPESLAHARRLVSEVNIVTQ